MIKYNYPSWWNQSGTTDPDVHDWSAMEAEAKLIETQNRETTKPYKEKLLEFRKFVELVWGEKSKEAKYIKSMWFPDEPRIDGTLRYRKEDWQKKTDKIKEEQRIKEEKESTFKLQQEAILWLQNRGKLLGKDFDLGSAISFANDKAFEEEISRRIKAGGFIDFAGQNCDGPCQGWSPGAHRCECGNRRVSWATDYRFSFLTPDIYAEAY